MRQAHEALEVPPISASCPLPFVGTGTGSPTNPGLGPCAAVPPPYPDYGPYGSAAALDAAARRLSDDLRAYIIKWFHGQASATVPSSLLPNGMEDGIGAFTLERPDQVDPAKQWLVRPAHNLDPNQEEGFYPDPSVTYLVQPTFYAPFGTRVTMTGEFPHSRFFDVQVSPPFNPNVYYYGGTTGAGASEVPIADVDIKPDRGSLNPFLPGANRAARNRRYTVRINMTQGDPVALNPAFRPPFRGTKDNTLNGAGLEYVGPGGCDKAYQPLSKGRGCFSAGNIWVRYYLPDHMDPKGSVPLPKLLYSIRFDGRWHKFYLAADISKITAFANQQAQVQGPGIIPPGDPRPDTEGSSIGWFPEYGVLRTVAESLSRGLLSPGAPTIQAGNSYARSYDKGFDSHGQDVPGEGSYEHAATEADYVNYLTRTMNRANGNVVVITGRMPRIPSTFEGQRSLTTGQMRYWSLTSYVSLFSYPGVQPGTIPGQNQATTYNWPGVPVTSLYDEQVKTDSQGRYVIVYSTPADRPANADAAHGVTWVNWGPVGDESFTLRMLSVRPDWSFCLTPDEQNLGWRADMAAIDYDPSLFASNNAQGYLREYLPVFHYMTKSGFEALGNRTITPASIPAWTGGSGPTDSGPASPMPSTDCGTSAEGSTRCPHASGRLHGRSLGPVTLGRRRSRLRHTLAFLGSRGRRSMDFFCLRGGGIRVGYPSAKLLGRLSPRERERVAGRAILALTADRRFALAGVRPGSRLAAAARRMRLRGGYRVGLNTWYIVQRRQANGIFKVRHGVIEEIGIVDKRLSTGRAATRRLLKSFD